MNFNRALDWLVEQGKKELANQGHRATGRAIESLRHEIVLRNELPVLGHILVVDYAAILDKGVRANRISYSPTPRNRGGTSAFIQSLIEWAAIIRPSFSLNERKGFAFAVATKASREGIPTRGSFAFSSNGRRTGWVKHGLEMPSESATFVELLAMDRYFRELLRESLEVIRQSDFVRGGT